MKHLEEQGYHVGRFVVPIELLERAPQKVQNVFAEVIPTEVHFSVRDARLYVIANSKAFRKTSPVSDVNAIPVYRPVFDELGNVARWTECDGPADWRWILP